MAKPKRAFLVALLVHLLMAVPLYLFARFLGQPENVIYPGSLGASFDTFSEQICCSLVTPLVISIPVFLLGLLAKYKKDALRKPL